MRFSLQVAEEMVPPGVIRLPTATTCDQHLRLPLYSSKEHLEAALKAALAFGGVGYSST
jgi:hypothetical protein